MAETLGLINGEPTNDEATNGERLKTESARLSGNAALLNALTRYRAHHDQILWPQDRPCDCEVCRQAEEAIAAAKGGD